MGPELPLMIYVSVRDKAVELLQNIERHFLLGINERHDLKLKHDLLVFDARLDTEANVADGRGIATGC